MLNVKLEAPWYTFQKEVVALFEGDSEIKVGEIYEIDDGSAEFAFDIEVKNHEKAVAMERLMPTLRTFGKIRLKIYIFDEENETKTPTELYETLFKGNPHVHDFKNVIDMTDTMIGFVRFKPEVIQFLDDDTSDYNGNWSGIMQTIARDVFPFSVGVHFCTAPVKGEDTPLGDWK